MSASNNLSGFTRTALGVGFTTIIDEHIFTFLLSSPLTARTLAVEKGQTAEVQKDLLLALALSIAFDIFLAVLLRSTGTLIWGLILSFIFAFLYVKRGELM